MIELLREVARRDPDRIAVIADGSAHRYGDLCDSSESIAAGLTSRSITRVGAVADDVATVVSLLAGSSLSGTELCLYPPTDRADAIEELAARFDHEVVIADRDGLGRSERTISSDELRATAGAPGAPPSHRPLLVLTTGTTGVPRGVRHDWGRVLLSARRVESAPGQRWLLAFGLHQFAGLQILVHTMAAGATLVVPAERRPRAGLEAIIRHGVDHVSATPTWWRFLLTELRASDLPAPPLLQVTLGGEAAPGALLDQLAATFPEARMSHIYAGSEFGPTGSVRDGQEGLDVAVLDRGSDADVELEIRDGELWVRSRVGMLGYHGEADVDPDTFRPTGDLVEVVGDRIVFRGRRTEVINVGGVKVHPSTVETVVSAVPGVALCRAYGRANKVTGAIVAVEVVAAPGVDDDVLVDAVRSSCAHLEPAARPRSVKVVDEIVTVGDKIVRRDTDAV